MKSENVERMQYTIGVLHATKRITCGEVDDAIIDLLNEVIAELENILKNEESGSYCKIHIGTGENIRAEKVSLEDEEGVSSIKQEKRRGGLAR